MVQQIGKLLEKKGQLKEALNFLNQKILENVQDIRFYEEKGISTLDVAAALMRNSQQEEIIKCWEFGIEQNQSNIEFYKAKINALKKLGRDNEVIECINKWMRLNKNCSLVEFELSQISSSKFECNNLRLIYQQLQINLINQSMIMMRRNVQQKKKFYVQIISETILPIVNQDEIQLANMLKKLGKDKEILQCWDWGVMNNINNIDFYYAKSMHLESLGKDQEAVDCWWFGISKNKNFIKFYDAFSNLLTKLNRNQEVADCMQLGIEQNPQNISFYTKKVNVLLKLGEEQKVINCLDYGISQNKTKIEFYNYKCQILKDLGRNQDCIECLELGIQNNPTDFQFYYRKAYKLKELDRVEEELQCWQRGIEIQKDSSNYYSEKFDVLMRLHRYEEALKVWDDGIQSNIHDGRFYYLKAQALDTLERNDEVLLCWDKGILNNPDNFSFYEQKCDALMKFEKLVAAEESWSSDQEGSNKSDNESCKNEQTSPLPLSENAEKALQCLDEGISRNPSDFAFYNKKVDLLKKLGKKKEAVVCLKIGQEKNQNDPEFYLALAEELLSQKNLLESIYYIDQGLKRFNDERLMATKWLLLSKQNMLRKAIIYFRLSEGWSYQGRKLKYNL
ncbi:unnamed protein product [Paramecium octaurelia]|uniref:Tetratricopeptide repeat protein n=1 Tax=Paramecium octaurelia TaxID=43137 RepID=A0A8S1YIT4_PAROT|nr:unnamed protein product [Paramecium octaurelia]